MRRTVLPVILNCLLFMALSWGNSLGNNRDSGNIPAGPENKEKIPFEEYRERRPAMGTVFTVTLYKPSDMPEDHLHTIMEQVWETLFAWEKTASFFDAESELSGLNNAAPGKPIKVSSRLFQVISQAYYVAKLSDGAFDPALGKLTRLWRRSVSRKTLPDPDDLKSARTISCYHFLELDPHSHTVLKTVPGLLIDLGGIAKGAALDQMALVLKENGLASFRLSNTSDILVGAPPPNEKYWKLFSQDSEEPFFMKHGAVSSSGTNKQNIEIDGVKYAHLIDPSTGLGLTEEKQVSVISVSAALADAAATALIFLGEEKQIPFMNKLNLKFPREFRLDESTDTYD